MKIHSLLLLMIILTPAAALAQSSDKANPANDAKTPGSGSATPGLDEYTELVQQYMAKRDALAEQRVAAKNSIRNSKTTTEKKKAADDLEAAEKKFFSDNAGLIKRMKDAEAKKLGKKSKTDTK